MRKVKNITVCVTPEIYRQARHLAAEYDSTVSAMVAWLLQRLPAAIERSRFPKGGPKPPSVPQSLSPSVPASTTPLPPTPLCPAPSAPGSSPSRSLAHSLPCSLNSRCETVTPPVTPAVSKASS
jgi:hypothetical protein